MELYKIIRIKILSDKPNDEDSIIKEPNNLENTSIVENVDDIVVNETKSQIDNESIFSEDNSILSNIHDESHESIIKLTINDKVKDSSDIIDEQEYVSITACFHWKVTDSVIGDLDKTYLIGTNIITRLNDSIPTIKIKSSGESIKYKTLVRDNSKKIFGILNKDIITIKHLNNTNNYHNYLVLLKKSKKLSSKFKNSINCIDSNTFKWRSYLGIFTPEKINPTKAEVYDTLSKDKRVSNTLSIDINSRKLVNVYQSMCITGF